MLVCKKNPEYECRWPGVRNDKREPCVGCFRRFNISPARNPGERAATRLSNLGTARQNGRHRATE